MSHPNHQRQRAAARSTTRQTVSYATTQPSNSPAQPAQTTACKATPPGVDATRRATLDAVPSAAPAAPADAAVPIGVGIDTSRYGHYATFLGVDLQPTAADLQFGESALGYQQLRDRLDAIALKHGGNVHFHIGVDLAGRYADNLLAFLHRLYPPVDAARLATISCGDPQRNKNYRVAIFGHKKSDPVDSAPAHVTPSPLGSPTTRNRSVDDVASSQDYATIMCRQSVAHSDRSLPARSSHGLA